MKQLFFLLLVSVAAVHEEEKEEKRWIHEHLALSKGLSDLVDRMYTKPLPCPSDECSKLTSYCDSFGNKTFCGCRPTGTKCSLNKQCCSYNCHKGICRCSIGFLCKGGRKDDCCGGWKCDTRYSKLAPIGYGFCKNING